MSQLKTHNFTKNKTFDILKLHRPTTKYFFLIISLTFKFYYFMQQVCILRGPTLNMPPSQTEQTLTQYDEYISEDRKTEDFKYKPKKSFSISTLFTQQPIIWLNTISIILFHVVSAVAFLTCAWKVKFLTIIWGKLRKMNVD